MPHSIFLIRQKSEKSWIYTKQWEIRNPEKCSSFSSKNNFKQSCENGMSDSCDGHINIYVTPATFTIICFSKFIVVQKIIETVLQREPRISQLLILILLLLSGPGHHHEFVPAKGPSHWDTNVGHNDLVWYKAINGSGVHSDCTSSGGKRPACC